MTKEAILSGRVNEGRGESGKRAVGKDVYASIVALSVLSTSRAGKVDKRRARNGILSIRISIDACDSPMVVQIFNSNGVPHAT